MRFLRAAHTGSRESAKVTDRLSAIADRGKLEASEYPGIKEPLAPLPFRQRFWTPQEVEDQANDE